MGAGKYNGQGRRAEERMFDREAKEIFGGGESNHACRLPSTRKLDDWRLRCRGQTVSFLLSESRGDVLLSP